MPEMNDDARAALALLPFAKDAMRVVRELLPEGTDFGIFVLVPGEPEGRVVALTTDRNVVAVAVAQWVLTALNPESQDGP